MKASSLIAGSMVLFALSINSSAARSLCVEPAPDMRAGQKNVNGETVSFFYRSRPFPLDIYSGFAPIRSVAPLYCVRYEAENKALLPIERFFWPTAGGLEAERVEPTQRLSLVVTKASQYEPLVAETQIHAFALETAKSRAYQVREQMKTAEALNPHGLGRIKLDPTQGKKEIFPEIGGQFSDTLLEVIATSTAVSDGSRYSISVSITLHDPNGTARVYAPFSYAMSKNMVGPELAKYIATVRNVDLPLDRNQFNARIEEKPTDGAIYVVEQPIIVGRGNWRACFLAASYSPVSITSDNLACALLR